jgi:hypothetical protein
LSTVVVVPLEELDREFNATCDRLELKKLAETNHREIAAHADAIEQLHRAFVYELRTLQARLKDGR